MKKTILISGSLAAALILAGCSGSAGSTASAADSTALSEAVSTVSSAAAAPETGSVISPLPSAVDMANLDNCTVAVSFEKGDAYLDDDGVLQLKVKVYDYDLYDMVDLSTMQEGDSISIGGDTVEITSLEQNDAGDYVINGGLEEGGYTLTTSGDTVYYLSSWDDLKVYREVGEAVLRVSDEFVFEDSSDLEKDPVTWYAGDLVSEDSGIEYHFVPNNTSITIQDGMVVSMSRIYNP